MADQQNHTRWTKKVAEGEPYEHVIVGTDGYGNWGVTRSWSFKDPIVALAWAKSLVEAEMESWVEHGPGRTGVAPPR